MIDKLKSSDFPPYLDQKFRIYSGSAEPLEVVLIEVSELGSESGNDSEPLTRRPFSIIFRGPIDPSLPQGTFEFGHDQFGTLSIFIVPIGPDKEGMLYQAVFN